jgi:hypothetical protein
MRKYKKKGHKYGKHVLKWKPVTMGERKILCDMEKV